MDLSDILAGLTVGGISLGIIALYFGFIAAIVIVVVWAATTAWKLFMG